MQNKLGKHGISSPIVNCQLSIVNSPKGFTLVEMLVVIAIIGILATLITGAAMMARLTAQRAKIRMEMNQIETALERYKQEFGEYPPDFYDDAALVRHVRKRWPRYAIFSDSNISQADGIRNALCSAYRGNSSTSVLTGSVDLTRGMARISSLAVWLGGFPNTDGKLSGFAANPERPFGTYTTGAINDGRLGAPGATGYLVTNTITELDKKTFIELKIGDNTQVVTATDGTHTAVFPCLVNKTTMMPYVYFRGTTDGGTLAYIYNGNVIKNYDFSAAFTGDWSEVGLAVPYAQSGNPFPPTSTNKEATVWFNPSTYQLIHPGLDGKFGDSHTSWTPRLSSNGYDYNSTGFKSIILSADENGIGQLDYDNITNFSESTLEALLP